MEKEAKELLDKVENIRQDAFVKDLVDEDCHIIDHNRINALYIINDYSTIIKHEYLMGTIIKNDNGYDEFYTRYEIIERNLSRHI